MILIEAEANKWEILPLLFRFTFIKVYFSAQQEAWTIRFLNAITPFKSK